MKRLGVSLKLATVFAVLACVLAGSAASAMAVSIEPLNTKFEGVKETGSSVQWSMKSLGTWSCEKASIVGTTSSGKTNLLEVTPAFSGCTGGAFSFAYESVCLKKGVLPWVLTLNTGGTATLKLNCYFITKVTNGGCTITAPPQTIEHSISWKNNSPTSLAITLESAEFKALEFSGTCAPFFTSSEEGLSVKYIINGIHAS